LQFFFLSFVSHLVEIKRTKKKEGNSEWDKKKNPDRKKEEATKQKKTNKYKVKPILNLLFVFLGGIACGERNSFQNSAEYTAEQPFDFAIILDETCSKSIRIYTGLYIIVCHLLIFVLFVSLCVSSSI
jgi:hypothetical protein